MRIFKFFGPIFDNRLPTHLEDNHLKLADPVFLQPSSGPLPFKLMWLDKILNKTNFLCVERHLVAKSSVEYTFICPLY